jgi:phosphoribosylformylglycinamidine synthase subunit PurS
MKAEIKITLKNGVLDPQGTAVQASLHDIGFASVQNVRIGKIIHLDIDETDESVARQKVESMCSKLLANTVIENFEIAFV